MESEVPTTQESEEVSLPAKAYVNAFQPCQKIQGKVPKRIHKSERERLKREHLNELFIALDNALGLPEQNNGKASILGETTRILKDMYSLVENLKRENATLLSESQYMTIEKSELLDEKFSLEAKIGKLRSELVERVAQSKPDLNEPPPEELTSQFSAGAALQQAPYISPVYIIPICSDFQADPDNGAAQFAANPPPNVEKPRARYPTQTDSWPSQLAKQLELG